MSTLDRTAAETRAAHPYPSTDPLQRLRHTVSVFANSDPSDRVIIATGNIYPVEDTMDGSGFTGLTHGDLRAILNLLDG